MGACKREDGERDPHARIPGRIHVPPRIHQPIGDVRSKTGWVQALYTVVAPFYPVLHGMLPNNTTTSANLGKALIEVAINGYSKSILYSADMNALAARAG